MVREALVDALQRRADEIVERLPVAPQRDLAGLEAHQVEHIRDELRHLPRLVFDRARQAHARGFVESARHAPASVLPRPPSPRAACADRARSKRASVLRRLSVSRRDARRFGLLRQPRALEREPDLPGEGFEQVPLLGQQHAPRIRGSTASTPSAARSSPKRKIERRRGRQRVGAETGAPAVIDDPLRDDEIRAAERALDAALVG